MTPSGAGKTMVYLLYKIRESLEVKLVRGADIMSYRGGVVEIAGVVAVAATMGDFERGGVAFGRLLRFAMICIFLRRAARRERMPWTTGGIC